MNTGTTGAISGAIGAAVATAVLLSSQVMQGAAIAPDLGEINRVAVVNPLQVQGIPRAQDMIQIKEGQPYPVPAGKVLVITALGTKGGSNTSELDINGVNEVRINTNVNASSFATMFHLPPGLTAKSGDIVEPSTGSSMNGRAWGYLVDE